MLPLTVYHTYCLSKAIRRAKEQAAEEGRDWKEIIGDRFGVSDFALEPLLPASFSLVRCSVSFTRILLHLQFKGCRRREFALLLV